MSTLAVLLKETFLSRLEELHNFSQESSEREPAPDFDWLDAFVIAHSHLGFDEFLLHLHRLEAWPTLVDQLDTLHKRESKNKQADWGSIQQQTVNWLWPCCVGVPQGADFSPWPRPNSLRCGEE